MRKTSSSAALLGAVVMISAAAIGYLLWPDAGDVDDLVPAADVASLQHDGELRSPAGFPTPTRAAVLPTAATTFGFPAPPADRPPVSDRNSVILWVLSDETDQAVDFPILDVVTERYPVRLFRDRLSRLQIGDVVPISLPDQGVFQAVVDRRLVSPNGDRCFCGHIERDGRRYMVVYTQGEELTFATICSPEGTYALEATGDSGILFLDNRDDVIDFSQPDTLLPDAH